jgi:hypothetical protein
MYSKGNTTFIERSAGNTQRSEGYLHNRLLFWQRSSDSRSVLKMLSSVKKPNEFQSDPKNDFSVEPISVQKPRGVLQTNSRLTNTHCETLAFNREAYCVLTATQPIYIPKTLPLSGTYLF